MTDGVTLLSIAALDALLEDATDDSGVAPVLFLRAQLQERVTRVDVDGVACYVHASDTPDVRRILIADPDVISALEADPDLARIGMQRAHQMALQAERPPLRLNPAWSPYRHGNFAAFFAAPRSVGGARRWVAEINPDGSRDVILWELAYPSRPVLLERYRPPHGVYRDAISKWPAAVEGARRRFARARRTERTGVGDTIDLEATSWGAVTARRSYGAWLDRLTDAQLHFLEKPTTASTRLRGPAGTGKTLLLELKALRELYLAREQGRPVRILFATHSWANAVQADAALRSLDETGDLSDIDVLPLLAIAQDLLPTERHGRGFELLGEDNLAGKTLQLQEIDACVDRFVRGDWLTYRARCCPAFAERVESRSDSATRRAFVWDLMHEFASVLSAHGILPGVNAPRQYFALPRMPWMMPLTTDGEKQVVLELYSQFVNRLRGQKLLSSDQLINDFLNYLVTFAWNLRRAEDGYDIICVDELHLFNEQERLALHYLSRDADQFPTLLMALDPRQSPSEVYVGGDGAFTALGDSGVADATLGTVDSVELKTVHRFTPEILRLVRHINDSYPALELGEQWAFHDDVETAVAASGSAPTVVAHNTRSEEISHALASAARLSRASGADDRIAVVLVDSRSLGEYAAAGEVAPNVTVIQGREDIDSLQYARRSIVLSAAEYVAGLQFTDVIVAGFPPDSNRNANLGHQQRRLLSLLYLAVSRATRGVEIHVNTEDGGVPTVLESALVTGVVQAVEPR